ncbi:class I SAM-dependent methyltransferase [Gemmata sp. G18]|uniref:Class I SAM-dependent methyltransferase n=1 Tax=Gemmata palustris TaxID=2822762 RepID=A0ABS5BPH7_9BACT|nr:class I SAM-dependent methyltransferase [Gemmata palustris]MBP3955626.1 class I SAM-dependent methyltransferase [Gemmata palustris]
MAKTAPDYDAYQTSFHDAFRDELYGIIDALPAAGDALDVPCGNGFYSRRLAERTSGRLTAVDSNDEYLRSARAAVTGRAVRKADAYQLPFADATFDLVWCAQSLISLDPDRAVREMFRVVKPDGVVAVLEVDEFHRVLLPWPPELEAAIPRAVYKASVLKYGDAIKLAPSRKLRAVLNRAGFGSVRRTTHPFDRAAPFDLPTVTFVERHVEYLRSLVYARLPAPMRKAFDRVTDAGAAGSLYRLPGAELICINAVYLASPWAK